MPPGAGGREANSQLAREFRPGARHERGRFFMPHLDESNPVLPLSQRFHDAVDPIARDSEDNLNSPVDQVVHEYIGRRFHG